MIEMLRLQNSSNNFSDFELGNKKNRNIEKNWKNNLNTKTLAHKKIPKNEI